MMCFAEYKKGCTTCWLKKTMVLMGHEGCVQNILRGSAILTHRLSFCFSDWTTKCLLVGPSLPLMRTEGWVLAAGQAAALTTRVVSRAEGSAGCAATNCWARLRPGWPTALLNPVQARPRLTPKRPHLPPWSERVSPRERCPRVASRAARATAATSISEVFPAAPRPTLPAPWAPQPQPATGVGRPLQQHLMPPHWHSQPQEKEHSRQLEDSSKLREWKRKPLQSQKLIKRKK